MKKIIRNIQFWFEYYIAYHLTNAKKLDRWNKNIVNKFPEKFTKNEK